MNSSPRSSHGRRRAFTLVELLVVMAIIMVLGALVFSISRTAFAAAESSKCLSRLRQAGIVVAGSVGENNGRIRVFKDAASSEEVGPYSIVREQMDLPEEPVAAHFETLKNIMFCPSAPDPEIPHWNSYGVNFGDSLIAGATWTDETVEDSEGGSTVISSLVVISVTEAADFVLLADSCGKDGQGMFRIADDEDLIGLRHRGKANVFMLDGSARSLGQVDLGNLGFERAYDTATTPPTQVFLPEPERTP